MKSKKQYLLFNILLILFSLFASLIFVEGLFRILVPNFKATSDEINHYCKYDPLLGWKNKPGATGRFIKKDFNTFIRINKKGLRDKQRNYKKQGPRIIALGDSFIWGYGVEQNERVTDILEDKLDGVEVVNMGCSGYGNDQEMLLLLTQGLKYNPDMIIFNIHFISDIISNADSMAYGYYKPLFIIDEDNLAIKNVILPKNGVGDILNFWLSDHLASWNCIKHRIYNKLPVQYYFAKYLNKLTGTGNQNTYRSNGDPEKIMLSIMLKIKDIADKAGAKLLFVLIPYIKEGAIKVSQDSQLDSFMALIKQYDIKTLELEQAFTEFFKNNPGKTLTFKNDIHWNQSGHRVAAGAIYKFMLKNKDLIDSQPFP